MSLLRDKLTSNKFLARNTIINFTGMVSPLIVGLFTVPVTINGIGIERFGILNLIWVLIGYFSLFDFGLSRALTHLVAVKIGQDKTEELPKVIYTALFLTLCLGFIALVLMVPLSQWLVMHILKIPEDLRPETQNAMLLMSLGLPIIITMLGLRGVLEGLQRFDFSVSIRVSIGIMMFLGPILVIPFTKSLFWITVVLLITNVSAFAAYIYLCYRALPILRFSRFEIDITHISKLLKFGGWMTISNTISPLMVYADRFIIGTFAPISNVSYYSMPSMIVNKYLVIPSSITSVFFPAFSTTCVHDTQRTNFLYKRTIKYIFCILSFLTILTVIFAKSGLTIWLGSEFANHSFRVMQILAVGVLFNGLAYLPFVFIQSMGRPDITAKFHFLELIFYIPAIILLVKFYGIIGAAIAWTLRTGLDAILLYYFMALLSKKHLN